MGATVPATEDARIRQARETLAAARVAVDDYETPYAPQVWAARLEVALETVLAYVDETAPGGQLDRIERVQDKQAEVFGLLVDRVEGLEQEMTRFVQLLSRAIDEEREERGKARVR